MAARNDRGAMDAEVLSCPACGGPCAPDRRVCGHCGNHLATLRCAGCSALHFAGARLCSRCGRVLRESALGAPTSWKCPRCRSGLGESAIGSARVSECGRCGGLFVDVETLRRLTSDREQARAVPQGLPASSRAATLPDEVRYLACPVCGRLMNRINFGRRSGVVVDVCRDDGTWFDAGELVLALEFVAEGGLADALQRERLALADVERRLRLGAEGASLRYAQRAADEGLASLIGALWRLLQS